MVPNPQPDATKFNEIRILVNKSSRNIKRADALIRHYKEVMEDPNLLLPSYVIHELEIIRNDIPLIYHDLVASRAAIVKFVHRIKEIPKYKSNTILSKEIEKLSEESKELQIKEIELIKLKNRLVKLTLPR